MARGNSKSPEARKSYDGKKVSEFAKKIRERRLQLDLDQAAIAEKVGVPQQRISKWEGGSFIDSPERVAALARALETTPDYLFGFKEEP